MFGFVLGTLCLIALFGVVRHRGYHRMAYACAGPGGYRTHGHGFGYGHDPRWSAHGGGSHRMHLHGLLARLDTTPGQDKAIAAAVDALREHARNARKELRSAREPLARAVQSETLDEHALDAYVSAEVAVAGEMRAERLRLLRAVHAALDARQRKELARILEEHDWPAAAC